MFEIKTKCCGEVLCSGETVRAALVTAVNERVSLKWADLSDVDWSTVPLATIWCMANTCGTEIRYNVDFVTEDFTGTRITAEGFN